MKYLSIDTETTGLDPENCQVLSFAAVVEDTDNPEVPVEDLPHVHFIFRLDYIKGEPYALNMNKDLIEIIKIGKDKRLTNPDRFWMKLRSFLVLHYFENENVVISENKLKVAGKNFSTFDKPFIENIKFYEHSEIKFHHRVLDVGSVFVDFKNDDWLPTLDTCMQRAGVDGAVTHDALEDARDVIRTLRAKY